MDALNYVTFNCPVLTSTEQQNAVSIQPEVRSSEFYTMYSKYIHIIYAMRASELLNC